MKRNIRYFLSLVIAAFCLALVACSSAPDRDDESPVTTSFEAPVLDLPMPEQTMIVLRVSPEGMDEAMEMVEPYFRAGGWTPVDEDSSVTAQVLMALLTSPVSHVGELRQGGPVPALEALDETRSMVIVLSSRGNEEHFRHLRNGLPPLGVASLYQGTSWRIFLPATDSEALRVEIEEHREAYQYPGLRRLVSHGDYVVADVHNDPQSWTRKQLEVEPVIDGYDDGDPTFWDRRTPAMAAFLDTDAVLAVYVRNEEIPRLGALMGSFEALTALETARPEIRDQMMRRAFQIIASGLLLSSPEVREVEDMALTIETGKDGGLIAEAVRTYTDRGRAVAATSGEPAELGAYGVADPLLEFSWRPAGGADDTEVEPPHWISRLEREEEDPVSAMVELIHMGGVWSFHTVMANYPRAFQAGLQRLDASGGGSEWMPFQLWSGLFAVQGSLRWDHGASQNLGGAPAGGIALVVAKDSPWKELVTHSADLLSNLSGEDISVHSESRGEKIWLDIDIAGQGRLDNSLALEAGRLDVDFDLSGFVAMLEDLPMVDPDGNRKFVDALLNIGTVRLRHRELDVATVTRLELGMSASKEPEIAALDFEAERPPLGPDCLTELRYSSIRVLALSTRPTAEVGDGIEDLLARLEEAEKKCASYDEEVTEEIRWMHSRWSTYLARQEALRFNRERALELYDAACERGAAVACSEAEGFRRTLSEYRPVRVWRESSEIGDLGARLPILTTRAVSWFGAHQAELVFEELVPIEELDAVSTGVHERWHRDLFFEYFPLHRIDLEERGAVSATTLHVDRRVPLSAVALLVDLMSTRDLEQWRREAMLLGEPEVPEGPLWTAFVVESRSDEVEGDSSLLLFASPRHLEQSDGSPVRISFTPSGLGLRIGGQDLPAIAGCPDDGPTVCFSEEGSEGESAGKGLGAVLGDLDLGSPPVFVLESSDDMPFYLAAEVHESLGLWMDDNYPRELLLIAVE